MAEFQMVAKNLERLCNTYHSLVKCGTDECPLYYENLCYAKIMVYVLWDKADRLEDVVLAWAEEHPESEYPSWYEWLTSIGAVMQKVKPDVALNLVETGLLDPIPADIAQKLGIEPK